ncbi:hypothetical protein [uncultured Winogradskyella sp.]|uniref:hypothetical protein n=1 Tax=uncultured Winogradskyella sp. TaxID=395353 RepID=UPI003513E1FB
MKRIGFIVLASVLTVLMACSEDERDIDFINDVEAPSDVSILFVPTTDNSGLVTLIPSGTGASFFDVFFTENTQNPVRLGAGEVTQNIYEEGTYTVKTIATGVTGKQTVVEQTLNVSFIPPQNLEVNIANDGAVSNTVRVTATADFGINYEVDFGETIGDDSDVVMANIGDEIVYEYDEPGLYTIVVTAFSAAIETTEFIIEDFEVTEVLAPITAAPTPAVPAADVIAIYSDSYDVITTNEFPTEWSNSGFEEIQIDGNNTIQYGNLAFTGIVTDYSNPTDLSTMEFVHFDYWTADATTLGFKIVNTALDPPQEDIVELQEVVQDQWVSVDIPLDDYNMDRSQVTQLLFDTLGNVATVFIDNLYFYRESTSFFFNDGLVTNGNFQAGSDNWIVGVDDNAPAPVTSQAGNIFYSVDVTTPDPGQPFLVNVSQKLEIIEGETYELSFEAWSNVNRSIIAGIGLSGPPFSATVETVSITPVVTRYTLELPASGFGALDARILFDLNGDAGIVNIDNVYLRRVPPNDLVTNGDFENGSELWLVGVDDNSSAPTATLNGDTFYSVDVTSPDPGQPFLVNLSQKLEIIEGETYTLTFDAWSNVNRSIIAGIGLSGGSFANNSQTVNITPEITTYSLTLTADGFGAPDARVLFDNAAEAGVVNIDNVTLELN